MYFDDGVVEKLLFVLDVMFWIFVDSVFDDMFGNMFEVKFKFREEFELVVFNFVVNKISNMVKFFCNCFIWIVILFVSGYIMFDFLFGLFGLVV